MKTPVQRILLNIGADGVLRVAKVTGQYRWWAFVYEAAKRSPSAFIVTLCSRVSCAVGVCFGWPCTTGTSKIDNRWKRKTPHPFWNLLPSFRICDQSGNLAIYIHPPTHPSHTDIQRTINILASLFLESFPRAFTVPPPPPLIVSPARNTPGLAGQTR
jgi:hypothetical protein